MGGGGIPIYRPITQICCSYMPYRGTLYFAPSLFLYLFLCNLDK